MTLEEELREGGKAGDGCTCVNCRAADSIAALEARCRDAEAKVAWLEGKEIAVCGYPWDQPYQDGYDSAKGEYQERIRELGAALDDIASRTDYDRDACGKRAADALAAAETTVNECGLLGGKDG